MMFTFVCLQSTAGVRDRTLPLQISTHEIQNQSDGLTVFISGLSDSSPAEPQDPALAGPDCSLGCCVKKFKATRRNPAGEKTWFRPEIVFIPGSNRTSVNHLKGTRGGKKETGSVVSFAVGHIY